LCCVRVCGGYAERECALCLSWQCVHGRCLRVEGRGWKAIWRHGVHIGEKARRRGGEGTGIPNPLVECGLYVHVCAERLCALRQTFVPSTKPRLRRPRALFVGPPRPHKPWCLLLLWATLTGPATCLFRQLSSQTWRPHPQRWCRLPPPPSSAPPSLPPPPCPLPLLRPAPPCRSPVSRSSACRQAAAPTPLCSSTYHSLILLLR
jgi:hypothetical protein